MNTRSLDYFTVYLHSPVVRVVQGTVHVLWKTVEIFSAHANTHCNKPSTQCRCVTPINFGTMCHPLAVLLGLWSTRTAKQSRRITGLHVAAANTKPELLTTRFCLHTGLVEGDYGNKVSTWGVLLPQWKETDMYRSILYNFQAHKFIHWRPVEGKEANRWLF